ncbi:MAG: InlB B-repeat-containing protein, partial [Cryomorphaceae bacterium]|nr:InlB B-repeat-containing protein [Cryomorphaceae bacterium]
MKKLSYILLIFIFSCAKDTSEDDSSVYVSPPSNTTNIGSTSTTVSQYTLTVNAGEGGSVSTYGGTYNDGTSISIVATPSEGYEFIGWIGSDSTSSNITLTISSNVTISANFQIDCSYWQYEVP